MKNRDENDDVRQPGIGVDSSGGPLIDPTKNVRELVTAESKYQDAMRNSLEKLMLERTSSIQAQMKAMSDGVVAFQDGMRDSETRRIDQLASTRQEFQNTIRDMLAESVRTTSTLVSTQLVQIQATFDTRVSKLEAGAFTQAGKQSVADPAIAEAMTRMMVGMQKLQMQQDAPMSSDSAGGGVAKGRADASARLVTVILAAAAVLGVVAAFVGAFLTYLRGTHERKGTPMSFWMQVLILVTLITLCWGGGFSIYRGFPDGRGFFPASLLGVLGLILFIVLVIMFVGGGSGVPMR